MQTKSNFNIKIIILGINTSDFLQQMFYTEDEPNCVQCKLCFRFYETPTKLMHHVQKYCLKEKKYKCFYCSYRSKRRDHIRRHMNKLHTAEVANRINMGMSMDIEEDVAEDIDDNCNSYLDG